jgi:hypothetical protein
MRFKLSRTKWSSEAKRKWSVRPCSAFHLTSVIRGGNLGQGAVMNNSAKKVLIAAITLISAGAIAIAPTVSPPTPRPAAVQLSAAVQPLSQPIDPFTFIVDWAERIVIPPSLGAPVPPPPTVTIPTATSIGGTIKNVYNAIEPWVQYGFDLAAYAVGWIPYVGWLAPQITIFYNFGERIVRSITFNIADWLDGKISFGQGLINVAVDTFNSFVQLGIDQLNFWLPPLPPLPPFPLAVKTTPTTAVQAQLPALSPTKQSKGGLNPISLPIRTTTAAPSVANAFGRESRSGAASVVGNIKSAPQLVFSIPRTDSPGPGIGSLATIKDPPTSVKRSDGKANAIPTVRSNGKNKNLVGTDSAAQNASTR